MALLAFLVISELCFSWYSEHSSLVASPGVLGIQSNLGDHDKLCKLGHLDSFGSPSLPGSLENFNTSGCLGNQKIVSSQIILGFLGSPGNLDILVNLGSHDNLAKLGHPGNLGTLGVLGILSKPGNVGNLGNDHHLENLGTLGVTGFLGNFGAV